jgi:hypothetical protein
VKLRWTRVISGKLLSGEFKLFFGRPPNLGQFTCQANPLSQPKLSTGEAVNFLPIILTLLISAEPDHIAKTITLKDAEFDSIAEDLRIIQRSGSVELSTPRKVARIVVDLYRDGRPLDRYNQIIGTGVNGDEIGLVRFSCNIVDMDYLMLGDGKKGHCRLKLKLGINNSGGGLVTDVPKERFDLSKIIGGGGFTPKASGKEKVPVCWMIGSNSEGAHGGNTLEDVIRFNAKGDLVIVSVELTE